MRFIIILIFLLLASCEEEEPVVKKEAPVVAKKVDRPVQVIEEPSTVARLLLYPVEGEGWHIWDDYLVPEYVAVWKDHNLTRQGGEAFVLKRGDEVEVLHWTRNRGAFPVFKIRSDGREGWILGTYLKDSNGQGPKAKGER